MISKTDDIAGPRTRAPLGNKTANAKATAFQTPAPPSAKHTSPRMRRAQINIHEAEATTAEDEEEEPEIEYMPPREVPLPDHPDDWPHDRKYPQFEGKNLTRGWWSEFAVQKDDDDDDEQFSDFEEKLQRIEELNLKKKKQQAAQQAKKATTVQKGPMRMQKTTRDPLTSKPPQTLKARSAVSALSGSTKPTPPAHFAAPTTAAKNRLPSILQSKKPSIATGNTRHTVAKVASNSTLGYSKGRAVSASKRQPLSGMFDNEAAILEEKAASASLDELFGLQDLNVGDEGADDGLRGSMGEQLDEIDEEDGGAAVFQLDAVEL